MLLGNLYPEAPYAFEKLLALLRRNPFPSLDIAYQGAYWRALNSDKGTALIRVAPKGTIRAPALEVELVRMIGDSNHEALMDQVEKLLGVTIDRESFFKHTVMDKSLRDVIEPVYGLPSIHTATIFEALIISLIEQQIAWKSAQRAVRWLVEWGGNRIIHQGKTFFTFPSTQQIADASIDELKPLKITHRRIGYLIAIARDIVSDRVDLEGLRHLPPEEVHSSLCEIQGIGPWTASVVMTRYFGPEFYVAYNDAALRTAVNRYFFGKTGQASPDEVSIVFDRYSPHAGTAAYYTLLRWVFDNYPQHNETSLE
jgi:DNA-3-methyladenine glycosylase II